jgi:hypothetical protein
MSSRRERFSRENNFQSQKQTAISVAKRVTALYTCKVGTVTDTEFRQSL